MILLNFTWLFVIFYFVESALAGYGAPNPLPYPRPRPLPGYGYPWFPHHGHDYWDSSESDSREYHKRCNRCKKLKEFKSEILEDVETVKPKIEYYERKGCRKAVISCPFDDRKYMVIIPNKEDGGVHYLSIGQFVSTVAKCNKKGKFTAKPIGEDETVTFSKVVCLVDSSSQAKVLPGTTAAPLRPQGIVNNNVTEPSNPDSTVEGFGNNTTVLPEEHGEDNNAVSGTEDANSISEEVAADNSVYSEEVDDEEN